MRLGEGMSIPDGNAVLTAAEVARIFRCPESTVHKWRKNGEGPKTFRIGNRYLYAAEDVREFFYQLKEGRLS